MTATDSDLSYGEVYGKLYENGYPAGPAQGVWRWRNLPAPVTSILDVGCGRGSLGLEVPEGIKVFGIDVAEWVIKEMEKGGELDGPGQTYERLACCDLTKGVPPNWPYAAMVFSCDVLEHIEPEDLDAFWRNVLKLVKNRAWIRLSIGLGESVFRHADYGQLHRNLWGFQEWTRWLLQTVDLTTCRGAAIEATKHVALYQGRLFSPKKLWKEANVTRQMKRLEGAQTQEREEVSIPK